MCCDGSSSQELLFPPEAVEVSGFHLWGTDLARGSHRSVTRSPRGDVEVAGKLGLAGSAAPPSAPCGRRSWEGRGQKPEARPERDRDRCDRCWRVATVGLSQAGQEVRALRSASRDTFPELPPSVCLTGQGDKGKENRRCCRKIHPDQSPKGSKLLYKPERFLTVSLW